MATLWPWLVIAGLGALHGLNPASGWMFAAACGLHAGDAAQARRALLPIAIGHAASIAIVACAVALGMSLDRGGVQVLAGVLLIGAAMMRGLRAALPPRSGRVGIALWSFVMATAHGSGLMLVPAFVPLCLSDNPARALTASGSLVVALAAVGIHTAAMLATTGAVAAGVCRGSAMHPRLLSGATSQRAWTAALVITGVLLVALR